MINTSSPALAREAVGADQSRPLGLENNDGLICNFVHDVRNGWAPSW
jgi:hypothetical protein